MHVEQRYYDFLDSIERKRLTGEIPTLMTDKFPELTNQKALDIIILWARRKYGK